MLFTDVGLSRFCPRLRPASVAAAVPLPSRWHGAFGCGQNTCQRAWDIIRGQGPGAAKEFVIKKVLPVAQASRLC